ncbi:MAG: hypothetical protein FJW27_10215 [Acidimicrobiia bacterium]|nr:hypothetical protein [Acidimicrobiia bacterium]
MTASRTLVVGLWIVLAAAAPARADGPEEASAAAQRSGPAQDPAPDFFFGQPRGWFALRGGLLMPRASGDLFTFVSEQLTVSHSDFRAPSFNMELGFLLTESLAAEAGLDLGQRTVHSEYRRFISSTGSPITQTTKLVQNGFVIGLRYTPAGQGQRISRFAFIPRRMTPYVGAGLQAAYYSFAQNGNFVDFVDRSIFPDAFRSDGWAMGPYVRGGVDLQLWRRLYANGDIRYAWLRSDLSRDFVGFDGIDLAGARAATGISVKF